MFGRLIALLLALWLANPALAQQATDGGQARMAELRVELAPGKQIFMARQMNLNSAEEAGFWPIYDEHQKGLAELAERRRANFAAIALFANGGLDQGDAKDLARDALAIAAEEARLFDRTHGRMSRALDPVKALKYIALELKLAALARYEAASALP